MVNKTISLSDVAEVALDKRLKKDPEFNFSGWVSAKLSKEQEDKIEDIDSLQVLLRNADLEIEAIENRKELLREKIAKVKVRQEENKDTELEDLRIEEKERVWQINNFTDSFVTFFKDIGLPEARNLAIEFMSIPKDERGTIFAFAEQKGLKVKDDGRPKKE